MIRGSGPLECQVILESKPGRPGPTPHVRKRVSFVIFLCITLLLGCAKSAVAFTALVAFGDSYTDTGIAPSSPPYYWNGRFSNGPLLIEYLSQILGFAYNPANNFAVSGTESDELGLQIDHFAGTTDSKNVLFSIWSGNNDFGNHLNIGVNDAAWNTQINSVVSSLMEASDLLYQKGARNIVLFNQIELTRVPYILNNYSASFRSYIAWKIQTFNSRLAQAVPNLLNSHPGLQVYLIDIHSDLDYLLNSYASLGFTQATLGALDDPNLSDTSFSGPGAEYVFWDSEHPTTKTYGLLAKWVAHALPAPPPPTVAITTPENAAQFTAPATISINAMVVSNGWAISQVVFFQNGSRLGQINSPPYTFVISSVADGDNVFSAQATYGPGQTVASSPIQVFVAPPTGAPPSAPWNHLDIGAVGQPGSAYYSDGTFTISGSGTNISALADAFQYVYQSFTGDGTIIARVTGIQDTDGYAKAGLMFRETLDPGSPNAMPFVTPSFGADFQSRAGTGDASTYIQGISSGMPCWLKLERRGDTFRGYSAPDGTNWVLLGAVSIPMAKAIYAGLAVTAHNNALLNTATFDNVQLVRPAMAVLPPRPESPRVAY
jgi:phospholipase/lecithinase/hemolysin